MPRVGFGILLLLLLSTSRGFGVGEQPVYETYQKPKPNVGEIVKHYPGTFLSCQDLNGPILHACPAYGVLGMRLCYAQGQNATYYVAKNNWRSPLSAYNGNDCMERARLARFLCNKGIESSRFHLMHCLQLGH